MYRDLEKAAREAKEDKEQAVANAKKQAEADLLQAEREGEVLKKQASEKTEQETEALKALAQGKKRRRYPQSSKHCSDDMGRVRT